MMTITEALRGEHGVLYRLLDYCAEQAQDWDAEAARAAGGALDSALRSHAQIEDELLFEALAGELPAEGGPLAVMRGEHREIEDALGGLATQSDPDALRNLFRRIAGLAREHFAKEERVLFPLAEQYLDQARLQDLGDRWSRSRGVSLG